MLHGVDKSLGQNLEDRMGALGMFTPVPGEHPPLRHKQFNQPQLMTYERRKKKVKKTNPITVFCSISSSIPASSSFLSSTSSKH